MYVSQVHHQCAELSRNLTEDSDIDGTYLKDPSGQDIIKQLNQTNIVNTVVESNRTVETQWNLNDETPIPEVTRQFGTVPGPRMAMAQQLKQSVVENKAISDRFRHRMTGG